MKPTEFSRHLSRLGAWAFAFGTAVGWGSLVMPGTVFLPKAGPLGTCIGVFVGAAIMAVIAWNYHYMPRLAPWFYVGFESISHLSGEFRFSLRKTFRVMVAAIMASAFAYAFLVLLPALAPAGTGGWPDSAASIGGQGGARCSATEAGAAAQVTCADMGFNGILLKPVTTATLGKALSGGL